VGVGGVQQPAELRAGPTVDHHCDQGLSEAVSAVGREDKDVREVRQRDTVGHGAGEADHCASILPIGADHAPGSAYLGFDVGASTPSSPVRLLRQKRPHYVEIHTGRVVVEYVAGRHCLRHVRHLPLAGCQVMKQGCGAGGEGDEQ
jgi:hypothetical protein